MVFFSGSGLFKKSAYFIPIPLQDAGFSAQLGKLNKAQAAGNDKSFPRLVTQYKFSS